MRFPAPRALLLPSLLIAAALTGCVSDSGLHTNVKPLKPSADALLQTIGPGANGAWPTPDWVKRYRDPQLDELTAEALQNNPDLQIAKARVGAAQAQLEQFASLTGLAGTAGATVSKARLPQPDDVANVSVGGQQIPVQLFNDPVVSPAALFAGLSYQLDLWGKNAALTGSLLSTRGAGTAHVDGRARDALLRARPRLCDAGHSAAKATGRGERRCGVAGARCARPR